MLKRGDILKSRRTGRYLVVREVIESDSPGLFWCISAKVRKDGAVWGRDEVDLATTKKPIPFGYELVVHGEEPDALVEWRGKH